MTIQVDPPVEPDLIPQQQGTNSSVDGKEEWKKRYTGSVKKIEELTLANRALQQQLDGFTSQIEQVKSQLSIKDVDAAIGERDKRLQEIIQAKSQAEQELDGLRSLKLKIEVAREIGRPELIEIIDHIPSMSDKETLKSVMSDFAKWGEGIAKKRETQLLAGVTPPTGNIQQSPATPNSSNEWQSIINKLPLGSPERAKAMNDWWAWEDAKHK